MAVLFSARGVVKERADPVGGVAVARGVVKSALTPLAVLALPVVLLKSAWSPLTVLPPPVVLLRSASTPTGGVVGCQWCCYGAHRLRWRCCSRPLCC